MKGSKLQINGSLKAAEQLRLPLAVTQTRPAPHGGVSLPEPSVSSQFEPSLKSLVVLDLPSLLAAWVTLGGGWYLWQR